MSLSSPSHRLGVFARGTEYAISLNVTDTEDQYSTVKSYLTVRSGPTSCDFTVPSYEELDEVGARQSVLQRLGW